MSQPCLRRSLVPALVMFAGLEGACARSPTTPVGTSREVSGTYALAVWNNLTMPVPMGTFPPDTSQVQLRSGALVLNASTHTWSYWYVMSNSRGATLDSESEQGLFSQVGDTLKLDMNSQGAALGTIVALVGQTRIVTAGYSPEMEWRLAGN
jgi:hypothetical protein